MIGGSLAEWLACCNGLVIDSHVQYRLGNVDAFQVRVSVTDSDNTAFPRRESALSDLTAIFRVNSAWLVLSLVGPTVAVVGVTVLDELFTPIVTLFTKPQNW